MSDDFLSWFKRKGYHFLRFTSIITWIIFFVILYLKVNYPPKVCCCTCDYANTDFQCGLDTSSNLFIHTLFGFENCSDECVKHDMVLLRVLNESQFNELVKSKLLPDPFFINFSGGGDG